MKTGTNRRLTNKGSWEKSDAWVDSSTWSPDGKQIAYAWFGGVLCVDLDVIPREGGNPRLLHHCASNQTWMETHDWSPDGRQILIALWEDGTCQIVLVSAADGATKVLKTFSGDGPGCLRFSRDGQYVAYDWPQEQNSRSAISS